jgi:hypothetical protein
VGQSGRTWDNAFGLHSITGCTDCEPDARSDPGLRDSVTAVSHQFSFEQQIQSGTQGGSANGNPFAYGHGMQARPWLHYDGIPNTTITGSMSYIYYLN